jgi:uncharacterized protein (DUF1778 family)
VNLRLTAAELQALDHAAASSGASRSDFVRLALERAIAAPSSIVGQVRANPRRVVAELLREAESIEAEHFGAAIDHPGTR